MNRLKKEQPLRLAAVFALLSFFASVILIPYQLQIIPLPEVPGVPPLALLGASILQTAIFTFVLSYLGIRLSAPVGLRLSMWKSWIYRTPFEGFQKQSVMLAVGSSLVVSLLITALDAMVFLPRIPELTQIGTETATVSRWLGLTTIFYGGIVEELQVRLGFMTLIVWLFYRMVGRKTRDWMFVVAIIASSVVFGLLHLPATMQVLGELTPIIITRGLVLNSLGGLLFGWLYWKKGLEYAMIAHMTGDFVLHVLV